MAGKQKKEPLRREHFTDEQWAAFSKVCEFIRKVKLRRLSESAKVTKK